MAPPFFHSCPAVSDALFLLHQRRRERGDEEDGIDGEGKEDEDECEPFHIK